MNAVRPVRVFIGLKLAPEIARDLAERVRGFESCGVRLVPSSDMHLTLIPPWNESDVAGAAERLRTSVSECKAFSLRFVRLHYGPTLRRPHLLWVECAAGDALAELRMTLLGAFGPIDPRPFRPHVTLARLRADARRLARKNPIDQALSLAQSITSVELFQSPQKQQSGYRVLASVLLGARAVS